MEIVGATISIFGLTKVSLFSNSLDLASIFSRGVKVILTDWDEVVLAES